MSMGLGSATLMADVIPRVRKLFFSLDAELALELLLLCVGHILISFSIKYAPANEYHVLKICINNNTIFHHSHMLLKEARYLIYVYISNKKTSTSKTQQALSTESIHKYDFKPRVIFVSTYVQATCFVPRHLVQYKRR